MAGNRLVPRAEADPDLESKVTFRTHSPARELMRADTVSAAGDSGPLWRVVHGVLRLDQPSLDGTSAASMVRLALPGDLLGLEALFAEPYRLNVVALTAARVEPVDPAVCTDREAWLREGLEQLQRRSFEMTALRTGPVPDRLQRLLRLLGHPDLPGCSVEHAEAVRSTLPRLRELAEVVDAKPETVCRALGRLLPQRQGRRGPVPSPERWTGFPAARNWWPAMATVPAT